MSERLKEGPESQGIRTRIHRKLTEETAEVAGGVIAGSTTFIIIYQSLVEGGFPPGKAVLMTAGHAAAASVLADTIVHQSKRTLREKRKK